MVDDFLEKIEAYALARLKATDSKVHPLVLRLASRYGLNAGESDLFQLLFVGGGSKSAAIRAVLGVFQFWDENSWIRVHRILFFESCGIPYVTSCVTLAL